MYAYAHVCVCVRASNLFHSRAHHCENWNIYEKATHVHVHLWKCVKYIVHLAQLRQIIFINTVNIVKVFE